MPWLLQLINEDQVKAARAVDGRDVRANTLLLSLLEHDLVLPNHVNRFRHIRRGDGDLAAVRPNVDLLHPEVIPQLE
eukprot:CAMPEP_0182537340 /NCGR_PEP_ID=MMETSP1323-20130603/21776_1 /TAXON_ID=236787 /ORGANISM="Florenciella parvula, Strain RCC1693" /LENGTH=76 /DNA_ID=CAMNT_0024747703 /DNA_START=290 /DNA_END=521 /DNA_ORIENTATION=+